MYAYSVCDLDTNIIVSIYTHFNKKKHRFCGTYTYLVPQTSQKFKMSVSYNAPMLHLLMVLAGRRPSEWLCL